MFVMFQVPGSPGPPGPMVSGGAQRSALEQLSVTTTSVYSDLTGPLKRHGPFVAFCFYCKIMLYVIKYTYYSIKTIKIGFHVPFRG